MAKTRMKIYFCTISSEELSKHISGFKNFCYIDIPEIFKEFGNEPILSNARIEAINLHIIFFLKEFEYSKKTNVIITCLNTMSKGAMKLLLKKLEGHEHIFMSFVPEELDKWNSVFSQTILLKYQYKNNLN